MPVHIEITDLKVRSLDVDSNEVSWCILDTQEDVHEYTFQVFRSESPRGPWDPITEPFEDKYLFIDSRVPVGDRYRKLYYKVRTAHKGSQDTEDTEAVSRSAEPDRIAQHIRRAELTLFTQAIGRKCWLFPRRTFGQTCPSCFDEIMGQQKRSRCRDCFDTGYLRGYLYPIEIFVQIDPGTKAVQQQSQMLDQQAVTTARTSYFPVIKPNDLLVEGENKRWRVVQVQSSERLRAPIKQELILRGVQEKDIEYSVPVNLEQALRDVQLSPVRMFSLPMNLDNVVEQNVPDAFCIFEDMKDG